MADDWREYEEQTRGYLIRAEQQLEINSEHSLKQAQALATMANATAQLALLHIS